MWRTLMTKSGSLSPSFKYTLMAAAADQQGSSSNSRLVSKLAAAALSTAVYSDVHDMAVRHIHIVRCHFAEDTTTCLRKFHSHYYTHKV
jgi:hypothetical protein